MQKILLTKSRTATEHLTMSNKSMSTSSSKTSGGLRGESHNPTFFEKVENGIEKN